MEVTATASDKSDLPMEEHESGARAPSSESEPSLERIRLEIELSKQRKGNMRGALNWKWPGRVPGGRSEARRHL